MLPFTLQQLQILKAVATEENFTKAAELLYLSQPSLSKQIKKLEKSLNILLINRDSNKISLTENGKVLLHYSERILVLCEESCRTLIDLKHGDRGNLVVGISEIFETSLMPRILAIFDQNYPQINIKVKVNLTQKILQNLLNQEIDIAIIDDLVLNNMKKNFYIEDFVYDELILIISKPYPFYKRKINKKDLYFLNYINLTSNYNINNILIKNKIETKQLKTILQLDSIDGIKTAVNLGLGVAFVPMSSIEKEIKFKTIEIIEIRDLKIIKKSFIITNPELYKSKAFKFFYNELIRLKNRAKS